MARVVLPTTFGEWVKLFRKLKAKDVLDGTASIIRPFNTSEGIDLATDETNLGLAETAHDLAKADEGQAEKLLKIVDHNLDPIWANHVERVQFGKRFYRSNIHKLADFGVTVNGDAIEYPEERDARCKCIKDLIDHHNSMPAGTSPFTAAYLTEHHMDLVTELDALPAIIILHGQYDTVKGQSETQMAISDGYMEDIVDHLMADGQFLVGYYDIPEKANDWGFRIDHSPKKSVIRDGTVDNQSSKTLNRLVLGSNLIIKGPGSVQLFKGKLAVGTSVKLDKDQIFKIKYGYGSVTLQNLDMTNGLDYEGE